MKHTKKSRFGFRISLLCSGKFCLPLILILLAAFVCPQALADDANSKKTSPPKNNPAPPSKPAYTAPPVQNTYKPPVQSSKPQSSLSLNPTPSKSGSGNSFVVPKQPIRLRHIFLPADRHTRLHRCRMLRHQHKAPTLRTPPVLRAPASRRLLASRLKLTRHQHKLPTRRQSPVRAPTRRRISIWRRSQIWRQAQASQLIKIKQAWL